LRQNTATQMPIMPRIRNTSAWFDSRSYFLLNIKAGP